MKSSPCTESTELTTWVHLNSLKRLLFVYQIAILSPFLTYSYNFLWAAACSTRRLPLFFLDLLLTRGGQWNMSRSLVRFPERLIWKVLLFGFILPTSCCWTQMWRLYSSSYIVTWRCLWEWKPRTKNGETERQKEPECLIIWNLRAIPELPNLRFILWEREPRSLLRFQLCAGGDVHK